MQTSIEDKYVFPKKAREKMSVAQVNMTPVYIYGMVGFGKRSFVRAFLGKKPYFYYDALDIPETPPDLSQIKEKILVFDNIQYLEDDTLRKDIVDCVSRSGCWVILISRATIPDWLTTVHYRLKSFALISEEDMVFDSEMLRKYMVLRGVEYFEESTVQKLLKISTGYALIIRILLDEIMSGEYYDEIDGFKISETSVERSKHTLWNYLEREVYKYWEPGLYDFITKLCIVEGFTLDLAEAITCSKQAAYYLKMASEIGNFLYVKNDEYYIHDMMIKGLRRNLLVNYGEDRCNELYYNAGHYYRVHGEDMKALNMFEKCGATYQIMELLIENARRDPSAGYLFELKRYYFALDEEATSKSVELMAGKSMLYALILDFDTSDYWYNKIVEYRESHSGNEKRSAKTWISYLNIGLPQRGSEGAVEIIKSLGKLIMSREITMPKVSMTSNLPSIMNGGKDFCEWSKKDRELAKSIGKIVEFVFKKNGGGIVDIALAESFFEKGEDDYEILRHISRAQFITEAQNSLQLLYVAIALQAKIHVLNGHIEDAKELINGYIQKVKEQKQDKLVTSAECFLCMLELYSDNKEAINYWMHNCAPDENAEFYIMERFRYLMKIHIYMMTGKMQRAFMLISKLMIYADLCDRKYIRIQCELLMAIWEYQQGDASWEETFSGVLEKAEEYHFIRIISLEGVAVLKLLKAKRWSFKNPEFGHALMRETEKMAKNYPSYMNVQTVIRENFSDNAIAILKLQALGKSVEDIAAELGVSSNTVKYHAKENYRKLGVNGKTAAVEEARKRGLI